MKFTTTIWLIIFIFVDALSCKTKSGENNRLHSNNVIKVAKPVMHLYDKPIDVDGVAKNPTDLIFSPISGLLKEIKVKKGDTVKQGQVLAIVTNKKLPGQQGFVKSLHTGVISDVLVSPGLGIKGDDQTQTSMPLFSVQVIQSMRVILQVRETDVKMIETGSKVHISFPELQHYNFDTTVHSVPIYSESTIGETDAMDFYVPNRELKIKDGMLAKVSIERTGKKRVLSVANEALIETKGQFYILVIGKSYTVRKKVVKIGSSDNKFTEIILSDLAIDDNIVVAGKEHYKDGAVIDPQNIEEVSQ